MLRQRCTAQCARIWRSAALHAIAVEAGWCEARARCSRLRKRDSSMDRQCDLGSRVPGPGRGCKYSVGVCAYYPTICRTVVRPGWL